MSDTEAGSGIRRREFLKRAALTGAAAAWTVPIVQTIGASPAFATTGSPCGPHNCFYDEGCNRGCMGACGKKCGSKQCGNKAGPCFVYCKRWCQIHGFKGSPCCNPGLCDPRHFTCASTGKGKNRTGTATYTGSLVGCT